MRLPKDDNRQSVQLVTATPALARTVNSTLSGAQTVVLQTGTTLLEVNALSQGIYMKYDAGVTTANFDEYIQPGGVRHYVKPNNVTQVSFLEAAASASLILIEK